MNADPAAIATLLISYTTIVAGLVLWLSNKFRQLERYFHKEAAHYAKEADGKFERIGLRLQRLELIVSGHTSSPATDLPDEFID